MGGDEDAFVIVARLVVQHDGIDGIVFDLERRAEQRVRLAVHPHFQRTERPLKRMEPIDRIGTSSATYTSAARLEFHRNQFGRFRLLLFQPFREKLKIRN